MAKITRHASRRAIPSFPGRAQGGLLGRRLRQDAAGMEEFLGPAVAAGAGQLPAGGLVGGGGPGRAPGLPQWVL